MLSSVSVDKVFYILCNTVAVEFRLASDALALCKYSAPSIHAQLDIEYVALN